MMICLKCGTEMLQFTEYSDDGYVEYPYETGKGHSCPNINCDDYDDEVPIKCNVDGPREARE